MGTDAQIWVPTDVISFSSLLHACAKSGDMSRAEAWLRRIVEQGVEPNAICYNVVIHACVRGGHRDRAAQWAERRAGQGGRMDGAEPWLAHLEAPGCTPDGPCHNMLLGACAWRHATCTSLVLAVASGWRCTTDIPGNLMTNVHARSGDMQAEHWIHVMLQAKM